MTETNIESLLKEKRVFPPSPEFSRHAHIHSLEVYDSISKRAFEDPEGFWAGIASELHWFEPWEKVLEWNAPFAKWFLGGKTNLSYNCIDRHVSNPSRKDKIAILWEGEPGDVRALSYTVLHREVCRFANVLKSVGLKKGDRATIYMGMVPELAVAMLACARMGVTHNVVFGGFSAEALRDRVNDSQSRVLITADGGYRRGSVVPLKKNVDDALTATPTIEKVIVYKRTGDSINMVAGRDAWWHELMAKAADEFPAEPLDAEHPLFMLYTSGTTGKPKGVVHTTGGYMTGTYITAKWVFDMKDEDVFWCTADIGWVTGHSYVVYGPLLNGATSLMYEGAPNHPEPDRLWSIVEKYRVSIFYTAPTAIRAFIKWGDHWPARHNLSSLRLLGTVGEPINPEAWMWYRKHIGDERCPIVDTWWQTETGAMMVSPVPGAVPTKPGSATRPLPGIVMDVVDRQGKSVGVNQGGFLVVKRPWPAMLRTIHGDPERYQRQYWSEIPGMYFTGDGARRDEDGYLWIMGRIDDVINVSGHRLGTMEVESALVSHPTVAEAAVVGRPDEMKGQGIVAFVTLAAGHQPQPSLKDELKNHVGKSIGSFAKPDEIRFTDTLPKTRSGKIMRRLLRDLASGQATVGDTTTLEDFSVLAKLREEEE
ncbi:MAG TPA: acetate--CoA ligase [Terriglobia bacterium]|nr:acetate--CoA ligase [Terriglobia bacterium]